MKQQLFDYAVLFHPKQTKEQKEAGEYPKSVVVLKPSTVLAFTEKELTMKITREIPKEFEDRLDQVEIIVRPF